MKKWLKSLLNNKIMIIIIIIIAVAFPSALVKSAQGEITTIVVALGIDKKEDKYMVSITSANQATTSSSQKLDVVQEPGITLADAFSNISKKTGRVLGFEHCNMIVFSDGVKDEDCKNLLDVLYRKANITLNAFLISTDKSAKDILIKCSDSGSSSSSSLRSNLGFNKNNYAAAELTTLGKFFNDYFSKSKCSTMAFIPSEEVGEEEDQTIKESKVQNIGQSAIFVEGKKKAVVDNSLTNGINWLNLKSFAGNLCVENVGVDKYYNNATVSLLIKDGSVNIKPKIENDILVLKADIKLYVEITEINQEKIDINLSNGYKDYLSEVLINQIRKKMVSEIEEVIKFGRENKIDIYKFKNKFYQFKNSEFKRWQETHTEEDLFKFGKIDTTISIYSYR